MGFSCISAIYMYLPCRYLSHEEMASCLHTRSAIADASVPGRFVSQGFQTARAHMGQEKGPPAFRRASDLAGPSVLGGPGGAEHGEGEDEAAGPNRGAPGGRGGASLASGSSSSNGQLGGFSARALAEIQKRSVTGGGDDGARAKVYRSFVPPAQAAVCGSIVTLLSAWLTAGPAST